MVVRVVIVDEMPLLRGGVAAALSTMPGMKIVDEWASLADAMRVREAHLPDLIILGLTKNFSPGNLTPPHFTKPAGMSIVCIVPGGEEAMISELLKAGASGCISKSARSQELVRCVEVVSAGGSYVSPALVAGVLRQPQVRPAAVVKPGRRAPLSQKEARILELVAEGRSNKDIAAVLALSEKTVKRYMTLIMQKINVRNRLQAALYLNDNGQSANEA